MRKLIEKKDRVLPSSMTDNFTRIAAHIHANTKGYIAKLAETVAIASVSGDASYRPKVFEMGEWLLKECARLSITTETRDPGTQILEGKTLGLPPVILGRYGNDPAKKTVLVYGHYDVQPALQSDGWTSDPWVLTEVEGKLYGRGSTDDKAPILGLFLNHLY